MSQTPTNAPRPTKVIKRYANRKLYDTERSCYVTLEEISQMIKDGDEVRVVDNKTKDDLTAVTLAQIIVEEEKKVQKMPLKLLRSIIQSGNDAIAHLDVTKAATNLRHDVEQRVQHLWKRDGKKDDTVDEKAPAVDVEAKTDAQAADDAVKNGVIQEFVHSTTEAFESWQKKVDERIQSATAKAPKPTTDIETLKKRVEELEAKLAQLEASKRA
jgi:polyhydroxyalkanoate synthesis repressor PhaR